MGEFQKQVKGLIKIYKTAKHPERVLHEIEPAFLSLVSTAKKEFPYFPENTPEVSNDQYLIGLEGFKIVAKQWFEKWFGK